MFANFLYLFALALVSPLIAYRRLRHGRYRRGWRQKLFGLSQLDAATVSGQTGNCIWIHAVSVGEVNLLGGLVAQLIERHPEASVAISTSTDTGYDLAVMQFGNDRVFFCPLDFTWAIKRTLRNLRPRLLVLTELELWPNLIRRSHAARVPVAVINGRLSDSSAAGYQRFGFLTRKIFATLDRVECQEARSAENFVRCGSARENVHVSGSLKFDNAPNSRAVTEVQSRRVWAGIEDGQTVWMVGSTQEGEEAMALRIYDRLRKIHPELRMILVPRHPERFDRVGELVHDAGLTVHRRSSGGSQQHLAWTPDRVILIDTIGELRHWWGVCQIATVGGSFGDRGGQNMLEPAGYGSAVSFGPNTKNFKQIAQTLLDAQAATRVHDEAELEAFVVKCLTDRPAAVAMGRSARSVIARHQGATARTLAAIDGMLRSAAPDVVRRVA